MATMTIRNLDDEVKARLRMRAAQHGRSMEEEVRNILRDALAVQAKPADGAAWVAAIREIVEPYGGIDLELPPRNPHPGPIDFNDPEYGE